MCGITALYIPPLLAQRTDLPLYIGAMTQSLAHRGPDAQGLFCDQANGIGLGHRRLSIIDLSEAANQPFHSQSGRYVMVYNGEVFNFKEIAEQQGLSLRTLSDTEVIVELFERVGNHFVEMLNGMFAFVIYDTYKQRVWFWRDRMGIKPLYYFHEPETGIFALASELKAFAACPLLASKLRVDTNSIAGFLHHGFLPGDSSMYQCVRKFPAGHYGSFHPKEGLNFYAYWLPESQIEAQAQPQNETNAKQQLKQLLSSAVRYRLISDVPVGAFLSGGIDSSIVAAFAQDNSNQPLQTFSIGFEEARFNEAPYARAVAKQLGTQHTEIVLSHRDALERFDKLLNVYDEPFADSSAVPTMLVSEVAQRQVRVALSGDGGDELFQGYGAYRWANRLRHDSLHGVHQLAGKILKTLPNKRLQRGGYVFDYPEVGSRHAHIFSQEAGFFSAAEINALLCLPEHKDRLSNEGLSTVMPNTIARTLATSEYQALFDLKSYLKDDLLVKVDRASMHHSLEVRVPLLDYRLIKFALNLPLHLKYQNGQSKYLLKQVLYERLPRTLFERPKQGFAVPLSQWLYKELRHLPDKYLDPALVDSLAWVKSTEVERLKRNFFERRKTYLFNRIWALTLLHWWGTTFFDKSS